MSITISGMNIDPIGGTALLFFTGAEITTANIGVKVPFQKHESLEQAEKAVRHKAAEVLEQAARALREHK